MTSLRLLLRSLTYYWRTNLAVLMGVIAGTAVIGGALIVGDSVRGSLRQLTLDRLGEIDFALSGPRFLREELTDDLAKTDGFAERFAAVAPALVMTGGVEAPLPEETANRNGPGTLRAGSVNVWGLDERLWKLTDAHGVPPANNEIILNRKLADQLQETVDDTTRGVAVGSTVTLWVELPPTIPREALLGKRSETTREIEFVVKEILDEASHVGRLSLVPNQQSPRNAFVSLATLQENLDLSKIEPTRRNPAGRAAKVNALFVEAKAAPDRTTRQAQEAARALSESLDRVAKPEDFGFRVVPNETLGYVSLESEHQIVDETLADAGDAVAKSMSLQTSPVFVYLANEIYKGELKDGKFSRYSVVAGMDLSEKNPFGPFEFVGPVPKLPLGEGEIESKGPGEVILNDWLADDLEAKVGDRVTMTWHVVGSHGELPEEERSFRVKGIVKLEGRADDRGLTPEVKGITDVETFSDWDAPFEMKQVTGRDDDYWDAHRATPKAFVSLKTAQDLWKSRYGKLTSLRMSLPEGKDAQETAKLVAGKLLETLGPEETRLSFQAVKFEGLQAASGPTNFSGLFIGFSFFLILSAAILIGLLFRLGIELRSTNVGLLEAVGMTSQRVRRLFLGEGAAVVVIGGLLGTAAAVGYASLMIHGLKTWWIGAIGTPFLDVYVTPTSLIAGFGISAFVAFVAIWWGMRQLRNISARDLLAGAKEESISEADRGRRGQRNTRIACGLSAVSAAIVAGVLTGLIPDREAFAGFSWQIVGFFLVGTMLLASSFLLLSSRLDLSTSGAGTVTRGLTQLSWKNAARQRQRSVLTAGLIASATFVLVAVAAGHRNPAVETPVKNSGNGGFSLVAQSSSPVLYDVGSEKGREELNLTFDPKSTDESTRKSAELLAKAEFVSFRVQPGEDASCLNIYQTHLPTLLGVPERMVNRGGFKFVGVNRENPWTLLTDALPEEKAGEGKSIPVYPVLGDMNTLQYSLKKGVGSVINVPNDEHPDYRLKVVGMFDGSVFQGVLLLSEANFLKVAPERSGYQYFLIGEKNSGEGKGGGFTPAETTRLREILESRLAPFGFDAERVADRLADFLSVQNTYLSTFQTLGGLGLLLGTFGLATVMLRNVLERRSELALMRAVGYRNNRLARLVLSENAFLLLWGLTSGTAAALLAMLPHLRSVGGELPWQSLGLILLAVAAVGMLSALGAVRAAVKTPIVATLRGE